MSRQRKPRPTAGNKRGCNEDTKELELANNHIILWDSDGFEFDAEFRRRRAGRVIPELNNYYPYKSGVRPQDAITYLKEKCSPKTVTNIEFRGVPSPYTIHELCDHLESEFPNLESFSILHNHSSDRFEYDDLLAVLAKKSKLTSLTIDDRYLVTPDCPDNNTQIIGSGDESGEKKTVITIDRLRCSSLESFTLRGHHLGVEAIQTLLPNLENDCGAQLRSLSIKIDDTTENLLRRMFRLSLPKLESLKYDVAFREYRVEDLVSSITNASAISGLKTLKLRFKMLQREVKVPAMPFYALYLVIKRHFPQLEHFSLHSWSTQEIMNDSLEMFNDGFDHLRSLCIKYMDERGRIYPLRKLKDSLKATSGFPSALMSRLTAFKVYEAQEATVFKALAQAPQVKQAALYLSQDLNAEIYELEPYSNVEELKIHIPLISQDLHDNIKRKLLRILPGLSGAKSGNLKRLMITIEEAKGGLALMEEALRGITTFESLEELCIMVHDNEKKNECYRLDGFALPSLRKLTLDFVKLDRPALKRILDLKENRKLQMIDLRGKFYQQLDPMRESGRDVKSGRAKARMLDAGLRQCLPKDYSYQKAFVHYTENNEPYLAHFMWCRQMN